MNFWEIEIKTDYDRLDRSGSVMKWRGELSLFGTNIITGLKTVGAFVRFQNVLAFAIGPDKSGERLGIVRLGGHIEENESYTQALFREVKEEGSVNIELLDSPKTLYKRNWNDDDYCDITPDLIIDKKPLVIVGNSDNSTSSTAVFLSYCEEEPRPSSETCGIIFLKESQIREVCSRKMCLKDFISNGGKLNQQKAINYDLEMYPGVHLSFLYRLLNDQYDLVPNFIYGKQI